MNAPLYLDFCHEDEKLSLLKDVSDSARFGIVATRREGGFESCITGRIAERGRGGCGATYDICSSDFTI